VQLERDAAEIRQRAERRLGELMAQQRNAGLLPKGGGDPKARHRVKKYPSGKITLSEAGIDKNLANRARLAAAVDDRTYERTVSDWRRDCDETGRVTLDIHKRLPKPEPAEKPPKEISQRAERRLGELMAQQRKAEGGQPYQKRARSTGLKNIPVADQRITLSEAGIDKNLADEVPAAGGRL